MDVKTLSTINYRTYTKPAESDNETSTKTEQEIK